VAIEPERGYGDEVDVEGFEVDASPGGNSLETLAHDDGGILGGEQQDGTTLSGWEAAQTGAAGGDSDGKIERQEGFAALGFAANYADCLSAPPQAFDQPARRGGRRG
jgi:hypothetical protein